MTKKTLYVGCGLLFLVVCGAFLWFYLGAGESDGMYAAYETAIKDHENAAFFIATESNPVRVELNQVLSETLNESMSVTDRLEFSKRGESLLIAAERQIDTLGSARESLEKVLGEIDAKGVLMSIEERDLVSLGREEVRIVSDIRGLSYRANYHTKEIFMNLIERGGELSDAYIIELNQQIPKVEEQFNARSNLYYELEEVSGDIRKILTAQN